MDLRPVQAFVRYGAARNTIDAPRLAWGGLQRLANPHLGASRGLIIKWRTDSPEHDVALSTGMNVPRSLFFPPISLLGLPVPPSRIEVMGLKSGQLTT